MNLTILFIFILILAVVMTMTGRGGGNFYVVALVMAGYAMHQSATMGQFILMITASVSIIIFHKNKMIDWKLALVLDPPTDIMAVFGGYLSGYINSIYLKIIFSVLLVIAGFFMLLKVNDKPILRQKKLGYWYRTYEGYSYVVNLWLAIPVTAVVGLGAGALGISGGSFKVPLMVLLCGVPMRVAVGTSTAMVAVTALMGFVGHTLNGHFVAQTAFPLMIAAVAGGIIGGKITLKTSQEYLKKIFAFTTLAAAVFMIINTFVSKQ